MYSWGSGLYHALGHGKRANSWRPRLVEALEGIGGMREGRVEDSEGGRGRKREIERRGMDGACFSLTCASPFHLSSFLM